jgi:hypothetical protein
MEHATNISPDGKSLLGNPNLKNSDNYNLMQNMNCSQSNEFLLVCLLNKFKTIERIHYRSGGSGQCDLPKL